MNIRQFTDSLVFIILIFFFIHRSVKHHISIKVNKVNKLFKFCAKFSCSNL